MDRPATAGQIEEGSRQLWCVDSVDGESWYAGHRPPSERVRRHLDYERYLVDEVLPGMPEPPVTAGTSFGALVAIYWISTNPLTSHLENSSDRTIDSLVIAGGLLVPVLLFDERERPD